MGLSEASGAPEQDCFCKGSQGEGYYSISYYFKHEWTPIPTPTLKISRAFCLTRMWFGTEEGEPPAPELPSLPVHPAQPRTAQTNPAVPVAPHSVKRSSVGPQRVAGTLGAPRAIGLARSLVAPVALPMGRPVSLSSTISPRVEVPKILQS